MSESDIKGGQNWEIDLMRPEDAEGVARLFRSVYGDGYPVRVYMEPEKLIAENQAKRVISSVARTEGGDIVGHNALYHSAPSENIFESGAGLVHKLYRGGNGIFGLMYDHGRLVADQLGADALWGEPVTNQVFAQRMVYSYGMRTFAVEADLMPAAAYVKEASAQGRVGTFMTFDVLRPRPQTVYLPKDYDKQLKAMYGKLLEHREALPAEALPPEGQKTAISGQYFEFAQLVRMAAERIGPDFSAALDEVERTNLAQGVQVLQLWLKLSDPAVGWAVDLLRARGYFLGGPLPYWFGDDGLLMQRTLEPPHWDQMQIASERNQELVDLVKQDWREVAAG